MLGAETNGVDVVLDIVGGSHLDANVKLLKNKGRLVVIGVLGGVKGTLNLGLVLSKGIVITGSTLRGRSAAEKGAIATELQTHVWPLLAAGKVTPHIHDTLPLEEAWRAHEILEANEVEGKLVLVVDPELAETSVDS